MSDNPLIKDQVLDYITSNPGNHPAYMIATAIGAPKPSVRRILGEFKADGLAIAVQTNGRTTWQAAPPTMIEVPTGGYPEMIATINNG